MMPCYLSSDGALVNVKYLLCHQSLSPNHDKVKAMSPVRDQLWQTAKTAFDKYGDMSPESVIACRSLGCVHRMFPASAGIPERTNKEYSDFVMELKKAVPDMRLIIQDDFEPVIDESTRRVIARLKSAGDTDIWAMRD